VGARSDDLLTMLRLRWFGKPRIRWETRFRLRRGLALRTLSRWAGAPRFLGIILFSIHSRGRFGLLIC